MCEELDRIESEHYMTFSYHDGLRDGELSVYNGYNFTRLENSIYLLIESGFDVKDVATFLNLPTENVIAIYEKVKAHTEKIFSVKQKRALERLQDAINESCDEE